MAVGGKGGNDGSGERMKYEGTLERDRSSSNLHTGINVHFVHVPSHVL